MGACLIIASPQVRFETPLSTMLDADGNLVTTSFSGGRLSRSIVKLNARGHLNPLQANPTNGVEAG
jgi:hypothetical protein